LADKGTKSTVVGAVGIVEAGGAGHEAVMVIVSVANDTLLTVGGTTNADSAVRVTKITGPCAGVSEVG
jgi:hypothetical protein